MALFGSFGKKTDPGALDAKPSAPAMNPNTVIYTMPEKFLVPDAPPFWTGTKILIIVGVFIVALVGFVFWLVKGLKPTPTPTVPPTVTTETTATTPPSTASLPTTTEPSNPPSTEPPPTTTAPVTNPVTPPPTVPPPSTPTILPKSADTDGDNLTDVEEALYGTNPDKADTDGDGFGDLSEMLNGYNPKGTGTLAASGIFSTYTSAKHHYQILYPAAWSAHPSTESEDEVIFTATPDELVSVSVQPNPSALSLVDWYKSINPTVDPNAVVQETVGTHVGIFSPDQRTFYFLPERADGAPPTEVFVVSYNVGTKTETNFVTTLEIMIRNLLITA